MMSRIISVAILGVVSLHAQDCAVTVLMSNLPPSLNAVTLFAAQAEVKEMFAAVGVKIAWRWGKIPRSAADAQCRAPIAMQFEPGEPQRKDAEAVAYATPFGKSGVQIHVFPDAIIVHGGTRNDIALLAHVLAHEIGHVLERISRHSLTGIMKERFSVREICSMASHPLSFAAEDVDLIRLGLDSASTK